MANKIVSRDNFIATIGYDRAVSVVSKSEVAGLKGKSFDEILASGNFRQAAACAIYDESEAEKQSVVQAYNTATGGHYTVKKLAKLFGLAEPSCKKVLML
jgi:hypothetical protein